MMTDTKEAEVAADGSENMTNTNELNAAMARTCATATDIARTIRKSRVSFNYKRYGATAFTLNEVATIADALSLDLQQVNVIFFGGRLRDGKCCPFAPS